MSTAVSALPRTRRRTSALGVAALTAGLVPVVMLATTIAATAGTDPVHVSFTLEGCRGDAGLFAATGPFVCPDNLYTTGNLGKGWNELDLVPHRLTTTLGSQSDATTTYTIAIVADASRDGANGYDYISVPVAQDPAGCQISASALQTMDPGFGGADSSLYRLVTITQQPGSTCVFDYYQRLALGSSAFSGSSLQSNLANQNLGSQGIGEKRVSIPDTPAPQTIDKDMTATRGSDHVWSVTKSPTPSVIDFGDTCLPGASTSSPVDITVTWTKGPADPSGDVTIVTHVYANNPAHRPIGISITDDIYAGTTPTGAVLDTATGSATVPGETNNFLVLTHTVTLPAGPTSFNDVATATYTDPVSGLPPIQLTKTATATAPVQNSGPELNSTATISDTESITGDGLTFSVAAPSVGSFTGGYVAGTHTTGPVGWTSGTQSDSGSVTFHKTVYLDQPRGTSGSLSDTATLTGSDGFTTTGDASVAISDSPLVNLTIDKTIPVVLGAGDSNQTFTFDVTGPGGYVSHPTITFTTGDGGTGNPESTTLTGLAAGSYTVHEQTLAPYAPQSDQVIAITLPSCGGTATFNNGFGPATAQARKVTIPGGSEAGWVLTLNGPNGLTESVTTTGAGFVSFATALAEGSYTITETPKAGWDQTAASGCSFTVNYPADADRVFSCTLTNTQRGHVSVTKTQNGAAPTNAYTFRLTGGPDAVSISRTTSSANGGNLDFGTLKPGTYTLCELAVPAGTHSSLEDQGGTANATTGDVCLTFTLAAAETRAFSVNNTLPHGDTRTIGYWKNWNSCSGTGTNRVAMAKKTGNHLLDEFLPKTLGSYTVDTCAKALAVLKAASGKYAENQLAAQLLAAKLNVAAGASTCSAVLSAIHTGDSILSQIGYAGPPSSKLGSASSLRTSALSTAATLDRYNNGLLC
jgi:hypothetical protein